MTSPDSIRRSACRELALQTVFNLKLGLKRKDASEYENEWAACRGNETAIAVDEAIVKLAGAIETLVVQFEGPAPRLHQGLDLVVVADARCIFWQLAGNHTTTLFTPSEYKALAKSALMAAQAFSDVLKAAATEAP